MSHNPSAKTSLAVAGAMVYFLLAAVSVLVLAGHDHWHRLQRKKSECINARKLSDLALQQYRKRYEVLERPIWHRPCPEVEPFLRRKISSWQVIDKTHNRDRDDEREGKIDQRVAIVEPLESLATVDSPKLLANVTRQIFMSEYDRPFIYLNGRANINKVIVINERAQVYAASTS